MHKVNIKKFFVAGNLKGLTFDYETLMTKEDVELMVSRAKSSYVFSGLGSSFVISSVILDGQDLTLGAQSV